MIPRVSHLLTIGTFVAMLALPLPLARGAEAGGTAEKNKRKWRPQS